ncbi:MAG: rod shape-determining protein MreD [Sedimentisphaerales bacterium]
MKWLRFIMLLLFIAVLQSGTVMNIFALTDRHIKPNIFLLLLVYFAINCDSYNAIITSFALGFAADLAGAVMGPHIISYGLVGVAVAYVRNIILMKKTGQQAAAIFVAGIFVELIAVLLTGFKASGLAKADGMEIFAVAVYSAILWFMLKWPLTAAGKWTGAGVFHFGARQMGR